MILLEHKKPQIAGSRTVLVVDTRRVPPPLLLLLLLLWKGAAPSAAVVALLVASACVACHHSNGHVQVCWADTRTGGETVRRRRAHWRPMDDEEEDMALQPIISQQHWGSAPYRDFKTDEVSGQHIPFAKQPLLRRHADGPLGIDLNPQHCGSRAQSCTLLHGKSGLQSCPVTSSSCPHSEPMEDRGERQALVEEEEEEAEEEEREEQQQQQQEEQAEDKEENDGGDEEDHGSAERPGERVGVSVEVEIGRRLREIGDQFDHDHAELVSLPNRRNAQQQRI
ncbi:hypothetical protein N1851_021564 [Merluccius polli]|uniref:Uncharacterized protein n=1 Tax=Merluccius polli TaxID=89951 RepID=A0AA47NY13_MERPO|nr:hypothetical protein N1851_021564 [Merluccius polli]